MEFSYTAGSRQAAGLPAIHIHRSLADQLLQSGADVTLKDCEADIDRDLTPRSAQIHGWTASLEVSVTRQKAPVKNVIGVLEGSGEHADDTVVIGAHYDHLGYGGRGSGSLAKDQDTKAIHHGADDNGSGTATLLELARHFSQMKERKGRRLVFISFTGEESGLLGSEYYCKNPLYPLSSTVAMVNLDMVGRLREDMETHKEKLVVYGTGTGKGLDDLVIGLNKKYDFQMQKVAGILMANERSSSDHATFYMKKVPVLFFFTGNHPDYHRPSDTADKINIAGMRKIGEDVAGANERPEFIKVATPISGSATMSGPRLGIMPSYGDEGEGVLLEGVREGGPADKAHLQQGDRIVELNGKGVKNLETYMVLMSGQKKGDTLDVVVVRGGKRVSLKVKLE
jgi:Zn-dependent M28 family amino/carboxypeptidase